MDLKEARFKKRITQWTLSKRTGIHQSRISLIENGEIPKQREKEALATALRFKADEIEWPNS